MFKLISMIAVFVVFHLNFSSVLCIAKNLQLAPKIDNTKYCQEFRTRADRYVNFFGLDYLYNEKLEDELFRYKFYVQGEQNLYILFVESDTAQSGAKCYEFGLNTASPSAATFRTNIDGTVKVRTEELIPLSSRGPMAVEIFRKNDGELQMFVANKPYPLLRFPTTALNPKFISFSTRGNSLGIFYFNCGLERKLVSENPGFQILEEGALPVVYISFKVDSISRSGLQVSIKLHYNMTLFTSTWSSTDDSSGTLAAPLNAFQLPKLNVYSNHLGIKRVAPSYNLTFESDKLSASASENFDLTCKEISTAFLYCNLAFGLDENKYHLTHYRSGELYSPAIGRLADIRVFQGSNTISMSAIPFKTDVEMLFKFDMEKF